MVVCGYCPGTGIAATGSIRALVCILGVLVGGIASAFSYSWIKENILTMENYGKIRLDDVTGIPSSIWIVLITLATSASYRIFDCRRQT